MCVLVCVQGLVFSENKRNRLRGNKQVGNTVNIHEHRHILSAVRPTPVLSLCPSICFCLCLKSSSVVKAKAEGTLQKVGEMIHSSPAILSNKGEVEERWDKSSCYL